MTNVRLNTTINTLALVDRPIHNWYRFVLSFPPHLVQDYLQKFNVRPGQTVLDPFCGTGTTLVECKKHGIISFGIEANTVAHFASKTKTNWEKSGTDLLAHAQQIATRADQVLREQGIFDDPALIGVNNRVELEQMLTLSPELADLLLNGSISPFPLHKTLILIDEIDRDPQSPYFDLARLTLTKALPGSIGNLHFGPEVGVGPAKSDTPVTAAWLGHIQVMARDLDQIERHRHVLTDVHHGDARYPSAVLLPDSIDAVITSPPYPNEKDYTRTTRLESVLLGFIQSKADLRALKQGLLRSNTRNIYKGDQDAQWVSAILEIEALAQEIEDRRVVLGKTSGFERLYASVTRHYFGGMAQHLADLRSVLRPGAQLAYVVGDQASLFQVLIRTGTLIEQIAINLGYESLGIDLFRTRLATATKAQLREEVVLLRWPG